MQRNFWSTAAVAVLLAAIPATSALAAPDPQQAAQPARDPAALEVALDAYMTAAVRNAAFSGTVLLAKDGVPVFQRSYGLANQEFRVPNTNDTVYRLQSITKSFTAILIMMLQEEGRLSIDDRACDYLDDCPEAWRAITIQQLLTHTSGIEGYSRRDDWDETLDSRTYSRGGAAALVREMPLRFEPGSGYRYSNSGYDLLGLIIERVSGKTLPQMYQDRILTPLGMSHTGFNASRRIVPNLATGYYSLGSTYIQSTPQSVTSGFGSSGLNSTAGDLLIWDQALYSNRLITRASYEQMIAHTRNNYGLGWEMSDWSGHRQIGHAGSGFGFSTLVARLIDDGLTVIVLSNSDEASAGATARAMAAIWFGETPRMPAPTLTTSFLDAVVTDGVDAGIRLYRDAKAARPSDPAFQTDELLVTAGYALYETPAMDEATRVFELAIEQFPQSAYARDGLADIAIAEGRYAAAIALFETSLGLDPDNEYAVKGIERARTSQRP